MTPIIGSGKQRIQPIWVDDVAAYFAQAVDLEAATNRTFELGGPDAVTWNEFWERLKRDPRHAAAEHAHADGARCGERARHRAAARATSRSRATC